MIDFENARANKNKRQGFTPKPKSDPSGISKGARPTTAQAEAMPQQTAASNALPTARTNALALAATSHDAMSALQSSGLSNAAAYVHRKTLERNAVVDKVSDAIAFLNDPDVLEADIMSAAAAKIQARSGAWGYPETAVDFDNLFALPVRSQRLLGEA